MISEQVKAELAAMAQELNKQSDEKSPLLNDTICKFETELYKLDINDFLTLEYFFDKCAGGTYFIVKDSFEMSNRLTKLCEDIKEKADCCFKHPETDKHFIKSVKKLNLYNYVATDDIYNSLVGVFYDKDRAVATDGFVMATSTELFDKELDGKIIKKNGTDCNDYPDYKKINKTQDECAHNAATGCIPFIYNAVRDLKNDVLKRYYCSLKTSAENDGGLFDISYKSFLSTAVVIINMPDNNPIAFHFDRLEKFINAAMFIKADNLRCGLPVNAVSSRSETGYAMIMPFIISKSKDVSDMDLCLIDLTNNSVCFKSGLEY